MSFTAKMFAAALALIVSIGLVSVFAMSEPAPCHTDTECGCTDDCLESAK